MNITLAYDSRADTEAHIARVNELVNVAAANLVQRGKVHDASKLVEPEKSGYDKITLRLKNLQYGSPEYRESLKELKPVIDHHYSKNDHHPEFHGDKGVEGMSLISLIEMVCDWKAATERMQGGGDIWKSLEINTERFKLSPQLKAILTNTLKEMGW